MNNDNIIDKLDMDEKISIFDKTITNSSYSVYGLTGNWGVGKTTFIKLWENTKDEIDYIHIDAFKEDYHSDPLVTLINYFSIYFNKNGYQNKSIEKIKKSGKELFLKTLKKSGKLGINILIDKTVGNGDAKNILNEIVDEVYGSVFDDNKSTKDIIKELQNELTLNLEKKEKDLIVVIDELDRCRPDYALELLEKIKHIFSINKIKFIIIYNPVILTSIIEKKYGIHDQSNKYVMKFIEKEIIFPSDQNEYNWFKDEINNNLENISRQMHTILISYVSAILEIKKEYDLSLRDMQRFISNIKQYYTQNNSQAINYTVVELLRLINIKELDGMIEYVKHNSNFAINAPNRGTYDNLYNFFIVNKSQNNNMDYEDFYNYAKGFDNVYLNT